jgi:hypothetical protein
MWTALKIPRTKKEAATSPFAGFRRAFELNFREATDAPRFLTDGSEELEICATVGIDLRFGEWCVAIHSHEFQQTQRAITPAWSYL